MALNLVAKQEQVERIRAVASQAQSLVVAEISGISANDMNQIRIRSREEKVHLQLVRNQVAGRALEGTPFACIGPVLQGPSLCGFALEDGPAGARLFRSFAAEHKGFQVKGLAISGRFLEAGDLGRVADLPGREQALAMLMGQILAPVATLARTLAAIPGGLVRTVSLVAESKKTSE